MGRRPRPDPYKLGAEELLGVGHRNHWVERQLAGKAYFQVCLISQGQAERGSHQNPLLDLPRKAGHGLLLAAGRLKLPIQLRCWRRGARIYPPCPKSRPSMICNPLLRGLNLP